LWLTLRVTHNGPSRCAGQALGEGDKRWIFSDFSFPLLSEEGSIPAVFQAGIGGGRMTRIFNKTSEKEKRRQLRNSMTEEEVILWSRLKSRQIGGFKFRRQYGVGPFVVDFYCPEKKLALEVDGGGHFEDESIIKDRKRQKAIEQFGIRFVRISNLDIRKNLQGVLISIEDNLK
jgi:very-short-patch-repair endonuclease